MIRNGMTKCHAVSYKSFYDAYFYLQRGVEGKGWRGDDTESELDPLPFS